MPPKFGFGIFHEIPRFRLLRDCESVESLLTVDYSDSTWSHQHIGIFLRVDVSEHAVLGAVCDVRKK
jgi:hypothetical protein